MSQAAEKVLSVLEHVAAQEQPITAMAVAEDLGLDKSTASRLLALLVDRGWLVRDERTRLFSAGPTMARLGAVATAGHHMQSILLPLLTEIRDMMGETVSFHRRLGDQRVCVAGIESREVIRRVLPIGESFPLPIGPTGEAITAYLDDASLERLIADADPTRRDGIRRVVRDVRATGFVSADLVEHVRDVCALSVPVFDSRGIYGALTVAGPSSRWDRQRREPFLARLVRGAHEISCALGASGFADYAEWTAVTESLGADALPSGEPRAWARSSVSEVAR